VAEALSVYVDSFFSQKQMNKHMFKIEIHQINSLEQIRVLPKVFFW
jgi:hypothetical protein